MRIAVFRGSLTLNRGTDPSTQLVDRLRSLGHDMLHLSAVARPNQEITELLERDLASAEAVASFDPQALAIVIPSPTHESFPRELIEKTVGAGGSVVYVGPAAGNCPGNAPAIRFLAGRGFYFQSLASPGPQPIRSLHGYEIRLRPVERATVPMQGVYFLEVRAPYVLANQPGQTTLLEVPTKECCTAEGSPLPDGMGVIAAVRASAGQEALLTGDWLTPSSLAAWSCNFQLIANLLTGGRPADASEHFPRPANSTPRAGPVSPRSSSSARPDALVGRTVPTLAISAGKVSRPFVDMAVEHLRAHGYDAVVSCDDASDLADKLPGDFYAFVPVIDRGVPDHQEREALAAFAAVQKNPDGLRIIPINLHERLDDTMGGTIGRLAAWVWLPGHDSLAWDALFDTLVRVLERPKGRFVWRMGERGLRTFVSYSFRDHDDAARLGGLLKGCGLDVLLADETTLMNAPLREELGRLVAECDVFIALISPAYRQSNWSFMEAELAIDRRRRTGRPHVLCVAPHGQRVPRWYGDSPVCHDINGVRTALRTHGMLDPFEGSPP